jgi:tetratricopeptide (TPR) repeat protein
MKRFSLLLAAVVLFSVASVSAQSKEEAIKLFNEALEIAKTNNFDGAISKMNACVDVCDKLGADGADTKAEAVKRLPTFYFKKAAEILTQKNIDGAIIAFEETKRIAVKYGDKAIEKKASDLMPQLHFNKGNTLFKDGKSEEALAQYEIAITMDPLYAKAHYGKGLVYKKLDDIDKMIEAMDKAIEVGSQRKDDVTLRNAEGAARDMLVFKGAKATEAKQYADAVRLLKRALQYDQNFADTHYRLSEAFNKQALFKEAIEAGNKALELEKGGKTQSAKIYFEVGEAYKGLGNFERACESYKNAAFGAFMQSANHMIEHELKCGKSSGQ